MTWVEPVVATIGVLVVGTILKRVAAPRRGRPRASSGIGVGGSGVSWVDSSGSSAADAAEGSDAGESAGDGGGDGGGGDGGGGGSD